MKTFLEHLTEAEKTYEFRIKLANIDPTDHMDRLESVLDAYGLKEISKPKRLPIKSNDIDFPSIDNCQLYLIDVSLTYPVNDAQLGALVAERFNVPRANLVVVPRAHTEEQRRWNEDNSSDIKEFKAGEAVLDKPYEDDPEAKEAGKAYAEKRVLFKDLPRTHWTQYGSDDKVGGENNPAHGKTTNELAQGQTSPVGSTQNKLPKAK